MSLILCRLRRIRVLSCEVEFMMITILVIGVLLRKFRRLVILVKTVDSRDAWVVAQGDRF